MTRRSCPDSSENILPDSSENILPGSSENILPDSELSQAISSGSGRSGPAPESSCSGSVSSPGKTDYGNGRPCRICRISPEEAGLYDGISEMIVVTGEKKPNAAPIGIIYRNGRLFLRLFYGSATCRNLETEDYFTGCVTTDPFIFAESCDGNLDPAYFEQNYYDIGRGLLQAPSLKASYTDRITLFRCLSRKRSEIALLIDIEPVVTIVTNDRRGMPFNRGFSALIEACVDLTRFRLSGDHEIIQRLVRYQGIVRRCGRPEDKEAFLLIRRKMLEYSENRESEKKTDIRENEA